MHIVKSVAESLNYLHKNELSHGNVCLNNIFVMKDIDMNMTSLSVTLGDSGMHYLFKSPEENPVQSEILNKIVKFVFLN